MSKLGRGGIVVFGLHFNQMSREHSREKYKETCLRAVVVAQLVEQSLTTPEIRGSNLVIDKILFTNCTIEVQKRRK